MAGRRPRAAAERRGRPAHTPSSCVSPDPLGSDLEILHNLVLPRRFCGPPASANGGYAAGALARFVEGPARVRLIAAPPLDVPLTVHVTAGRAELWDGETKIALAEAAEPDVVPPAPVTLVEAEQAARASAARLGTSPYHTCFVCGPRDDGLNIHPGAVPGRGVLAAPWTVAPWLAGPDGRVPEIFVWAALDCPGGWAADPTLSTRLVLGTIAARIVAPVHVGEQLVAVGWSRSREGRKHRVGSAVFGGDGELRGLAEAVWVAIAEPTEGAGRRASWG